MSKNATSAEIKALKDVVIKGFTKVEESFEKVDRRFDEVDKQFVVVNSKIEVLTQDVEDLAGMTAREFKAVRSEIAHASIVNHR